MTDLSADLRDAFLQGPRRVNPGANMVGIAYTLRYIPSREDIDVLDSFADRGNAQRKGVEECPAGAVFVIDSRQDASAASAGCILAAAPGSSPTGAFATRPTSPGSTCPPIMSAPARRPT